MKLCKKCHKSGGKLAASHTQSEWDDYFEDHGKLLKKVHEGDAAAMKKLESKKFEKNLKHMRQFFHKYASDSGNVPACN
ncbi:cytochrome C [Hydrogenimonas sp.]